ncbi:MAG: hypothetical protein JJE03_03340 [Peptostreptococcaceae bacterium]|nr:hypothetical protein [Peptostreptococcaceae bacterium]
MEYFLSHVGILIIAAVAIAVIGILMQIIIAGNSKTKVKKQIKKKDK